LRKSQKKSLIVIFKYKKVSDDSTKRLRFTEDVEVVSGGKGSFRVRVPSRDKSGDSLDGRARYRETDVL
jgi:hypothetical protein